MFAQVKNGLIVGLSEVQQPHFDTPVDLPEDFDFDHIDRYELAEDGTLIRHDAPEPLRVRTVAEIAFAALAEDGRIDAQTAQQHAEAFEPWQPGAAYETGQLRRYGDSLYRCNQPHTSQADWPPDATPALWAPAADPAEEWPEWRQPTGAQDAYSKGAQVSHNGGRWVSTVDANVWEPGAYGWDPA